MPNIADRYDPQQLIRNEIDRFTDGGEALSVASTQISNLTRKRVRDLLSRFSTTGLSRTGITGAALSDVYAGANVALGSAAVKADELKSRRRMEMIQLLLGQQRFEDSQPSIWGNILGQLISGGAQVGSAAIMAAGGSAAAGAGAAAGAVALSDKKLKENIEYTGEKTKEGIPIAEYNYKGGPQRFRGVIAQDVEKIKPSAVVKAVDYSKLTEV